MAAVLMTNQFRIDIVNYAIPMFYGFHEVWCALDFVI